MAKTGYTAIMEPTAEYIVFVTPDGVPTGETGEKLSSHHASTRLHLAFSCYVFNDQQQLLVTQRALCKKVWPGVWTNSVCGHPAPNEPIVDAIHRRAQQELGMRLQNVRCVLSHYTYKTPPFHGIIEHEFCPVFIATAASSVEPNSLEVEAYRWMTWPDYQRDLANNSTAYSYWAIDQIKHLRTVPVLQMLT